MLHGHCRIKKNVSSFTAGGNDVRACSLDISKAFGKLNFSTSYAKLSETSLPKVVIRRLFYVVTNTFVCVKYCSTNFGK